MATKAEIALRNTQSQLATRTKQVASYRSPAGAAGNMAIAGTGAAIGGAVDETMGEGTSDIVGGGLAVAGFFMKSPKLVYAGGGMLMHRARELGKDLAASFFAKSDTPTP